MVINIAKHGIPTFLCNYILYPLYQRSQFSFSYSQVPIRLILFTALFSSYHISCSATHLPKRKALNGPCGTGKLGKVILKNSQLSPKPSDTDSRTPPLDYYLGFMRNSFVGQMIIPGMTMKVKFLYPILDHTYLYVYLSNSFDLDFDILVLSRRSCSLVAHIL